MARAGAVFDSYGFKAVQRYVGHTRYVRFEPDEKLTRACERAATDPREAFPILDFPPGNFAVTSLSHPGYCYVVELDTETGRMRRHKCEWLANHPEFYCAHFVKAYLLWHETQETELDAQLWKEIDMNDSQALAVIDRPDMALIPQPSLPSSEEWKALGRLAMQLFNNVKGSLIPNDVKNWEQLTGLMLYGREMGFDPMTSLKVVYSVNGRFELNSHGKRAKVEEAGGDFDYEYEYDDDGNTTAVTAILTRPGRPTKKVRYTLAQARKTPEFNRNANWKERSEDMLVAASTNRVCRRGASDIINAIDRASRRAPTVANMPREVTEELQSTPALAESAEDEILNADLSHELTEEPTTTESPFLSAPGTAAAAPSDAQDGATSTEDQAAAVEAHTSDGAWTSIKDAPFGMAPAKGLRLLSERLTKETGNHYDKTGLCKALAVGQPQLERMSLGRIYELLTGGPEQPSLIGGA